MAGRLLPVLALLAVLLPRASSGQEVGAQDAMLQCASSRFAAPPVAAFKASRRSGEGFDAGFYRIALDLTSAQQGRVIGATRVVGTVTAPVLSILELDFHGSMAVDSIIADGGAPLAWTRLGDILAVSLPVVAAAGEEVDFTVHYNGYPASTGFGSFAYGSRGAGQPYVWTLSEPYGARTWWPGIDHPSDKADSVDVVVRVPDPMSVASNGLLEDVASNGDGTSTWTWKHRYPISSYLVSVAAGVYDRYSQVYVRPDSLAAEFGAGSFPIEHFAYAGTTMFQGTNDQNGWKRVIDVLPVFEWWYGPYPFEDEKYGHAQFTWGGGMEHQTITSMGGNYLGLIAHELAHQWYGDAVGPESWPDLWLNEGFATMGELLFWGATRDWYPGTAQAVFDLYWTRALGAAGTLVLEDTSSVSTMFNGARVYAKGGMVLHMLRAITGDTVFRDILRAWALEPGIRFGVGSTDDFRRVAERVSGMDLGRFFEQWVTQGTGYPEYSASWGAVRTGKHWLVRMTLSQQQTAPLSNVAVFEMPVQIRMMTSSGPRDFTILNDARSQVFYLEMEEEPEEVIVDPDRRILRGPEVQVVFEGEIPGQSLPPPTILSIHPNPASDRMNVRVEAVGGTGAVLEVVDPAGRRVLRDELVLSPGRQTIPVDVSRLAGGVYVLRLLAGGSDTARTVVVAR